MFSRKQASASHCNDWTHVHQEFDTFQPWIDWLTIKVDWRDKNVSCKRNLTRGQNATPFPALTIQPPLQDMFGVWKMPEKSLAWDGQEWNVLLVTGAEDVNATSASKKSSQFYSQILSILSINVLNFLTIVHINVNIS